MPKYIIIVGVATRRPPVVDEFRKVVVEADNKLEAELIACQIAASHDSVMPVSSEIFISARTEKKE